MTFDRRIDRVSINQAGGQLLNRGAQTEARSHAFHYKNSPDMPRHPLPLPIAPLRRHGNKNSRGRPISKDDAARSRSIARNLHSLVTLTRDGLEVKCTLIHRRSDDVATSLRIASLLSRRITFYHLAAAFAISSERTLSSPG